MVEIQFSKLATRVRFPSPAPRLRSLCELRRVNSRRSLHDVAMAKSCAHSSAPACRQAGISPAPSPRALVAQWIERLASDQKARGSSPLEGTRVWCRVGPRGRGFESLRAYHTPSMTLSITEGSSTGELPAPDERLIGGVRYQVVRELGRGSSGLPRHRFPNQTMYPNEGYMVWSNSLVNDLLH